MCCGSSGDVLLPQLTRTCKLTQDLFVFGASLFYKFLLESNAGEQDLNGRERRREQRMGTGREGQILGSVRRVTWSKATCNIKR